MKAKKIFIGVLSSALFFSTALAVSAASVIESKNISRDMSTEYSKTSSNGTGYMYYHVGSTWPYDDVFAYSETKIASGMTGYASVTVTAINNQKVTEYSDTIVSQCIRTPSAGISGCDVAKSVRFMGARKDVGQDYVGYNYYIH